MGAAARDYEYDDEYDCVVERTVELLRGGMSASNTAAWLHAFVEDHFGSEPTREETQTYADRAAACWNHHLARGDEYELTSHTLRECGIVALPTDTVYGLVAVAADAAAVERVYDTKVRDPQQPLPIFVASIEQAELIADVNDVGRRLIERFWPGALTIVLRKKASYETRAAAGGDTIGVRAPGDPVLRELAAQLGPLTGTSANIAGREECHTADEVRAQLGDAVDLIVDAPVDATGRPSTIVDCTDVTQARVVRDGAISRDAIVEALGGVAELV